MERKGFNSSINGQEVATRQQFNSAVHLRINCGFYNAKTKFLEVFNQKFCHSQGTSPVILCARGTKVENLALPVWGWTLCLPRKWSVVFFFFILHETKVHFCIFCAQPHENIGIRKTKPEIRKTYRSRWRWTAQVCFIRGIWSEHEHLGIIMESLNMESIYTGAHINSYLAAKGLWEQSKTSQTKCLPVPGDNIWTMWEITF